MKIAGIVVLYNPSNLVYDNVLTYIDYIEHLFIVDNSESQNKDLVEKLLNFKKCDYINNNENLGIATALNIGARKALENNFDFALTMDQDSKFSKQVIENFLKTANDLDLKDIAILSPFHKQTNFIEQIQENSFEELDFIMTSGNLLNLKIFEQIGGFLDSLFIDHVDHEYCIKAKDANFKIIRCNNIFFEHSPGKLIEFFSIFRKKCYRSEPSPLRLYYFVRNGFYIYNKYINKAFKAYFKYALKNEIKLILFYEKQKIKRLFFILKGYIDYKRNKFGKY